MHPGRHLECASTIGRRFERIDQRGLRRRVGILPAIHRHVRSRLICMRRTIEAANRHVSNETCLCKEEASCWVVRFKAP
jgi:hypothetical protein